MATATRTTVSPEIAEQKAAEIRERIGELERFMAQSDTLLDDDAEIRTGVVKPATARLRKRRDSAPRELDDLRRQLAVYDQISTEHLEAVAAARRVKLAEQADKLDTEERAAIRAMVTAFRSFLSTVDAWRGVQGERQLFALLNSADLPAIPVSALEDHPKTTRKVIDQLHSAVVEPENVSDRRHLGSWPEFTEER